ncbi:MAG: TonB-dependent receptor [Cyclobacteriaceae bacterium]|nr:TonB-dependent receptor [Cyclobacteriaceae bacterium]
MRKLFLLKNKLRIAGLLACLLFAGSQAIAQTAIVSGVVKDPSGEGMPAVNVLIKGSLTGVTTDPTGKFSIEASPQDILVFSFIGYSTQEVKVGNQTVLNITMQEDITSLQEVVVIGYGAQKKSDLTGAVSIISGNELRNTVTASVDQALQGRVAGVQVTQNSGQPGGAVSIRIRGTTSLTQSSEPLYVIDGVRMGGNAAGITGFDWQGGSGGQQGASVNPLATLNPNDIESINVLKDASASAIYGSQAANGVIIITTKRGKRNEATVSYDGFYAMQDVYKTFDMMNLRQYADYNTEVAREIFQDEDPRFADPSILGKGTDWQAAIFQPAPMQSHTISISGGTDATNYLISAGYFSQEGIIIGSNFNRFNLRANVDTQIKDWMRVGTSLALSRKDERITLQDGGDGVISQAAQMAPHIPVKNFDGTYAGPDQANQSANIGSNPVALALLRNNTVLANQMITNLYAEFNIIKELKFRSEISVNYNNNVNMSFQPTYEWGQIKNITSRLSNSLGQSFFWSWTNYATYSKTFGSHEITAMAGTEALKSTWDGFTAFKIDVPNDIPVMNQGVVATQLNDGYKGWNSLASYMARVNYSFSDRYLLTATIRRDGSSRFGPGNRWGWFPSVSAGWKLSGENFLSQVDAVSSLKLRAGWGLVGNQEIGEYRFGSSLATEITYFGTGVRNNAYSNPLLKWESTEMLNVGVDLELFGGRVEFAGEIYKKLTNDLLLTVTLPATFGTRVQGPSANVGSMENKGVELSLNTVNIDKGKLKWTTNANVTINRNKVTKLAGADLTRNLYWYTGFETASRTTVGRPVGMFYGYIMEGIFTSKEEIANHAVQIPNSAEPGTNLIDRSTGLWLGDVKWKDISGPDGVPDGIIDAHDQTFIGDPNPDWTFGFNNSVSYGPFSLDVYLIGSIGGEILNYSRARNEQMYYRFDNQSASVVNRARTELINPEFGDPRSIDDVRLINPNTNMPRFRNGTENGNFYMSTRWLEDATYVRIQNIKLTYSLPTSLIQKAKMSRAVVYGNIQNIATFTKYSGLDPQIGAFNQSALQQNVDMGRYPAPRVYTLGINVVF